MSPDRPARSGRIELTLGLLALSLIAGAGVGLALRRSIPVQPGLVVAPADLDFGTVWEQPAYRYMFAVTNPTDRPVRVAEIGTTCGCTKVEPQTFTVPPGGRQEIALTLDLTGRAGTGDTGLFQVRLKPVIAHQPPGGRTEWVIRGEVRRNPIELSVSAIDLGDSVIRGEPPSTGEIEVSLPESAPFDGLRASCPAEAGVAALEALGPRRWRLTFTPSPGLPLGPFSFLVRVEAVGEERDRTGSPLFRDVPVRGTVRDDIAAWPGIVNFGVIEVGKTEDEYVVIASHAGRAFEVDRVESPEGVTVKPAAEQIGDGSRTYVVTQTARARGEQKGRVEFHVRRADPPAGEPAEMTIPLDLSYYGTAPPKRP